MSAAELQNKLIEKIKGTKEQYVLEEVCRLLEFEEDTATVYQIREEQQQLINASLKEIEQGEFFTDEEVRKDTLEWTKK